MSSSPSSRWTTPGELADSEDYRTAETFVRTVKTTNDLAERAVKMATDYSQILTKDEDTRRAYPDFKSLL